MRSSKYSTKRSLKVKRGRSAVLMSATPSMMSRSGLRRKITQSANRPIMRLCRLTDLLAPIGISVNRAGNSDIDKTQANRAPKPDNVPRSR